MEVEAGLSRVREVKLYKGLVSMNVIDQLCLLGGSYARQESFPRDPGKQILLCLMKVFQVIGF